MVHFQECSTLFLSYDVQPSGIMGMLFHGGALFVCVHLALCAFGSLCIWLYLCVVCLALAIVYLSSLHFKASLFSFFCWFKVWEELYMGAVSTLCCSIGHAVS